MIEWHQIVVRLLVAALLGGVIGFERERKDWAPGTRTHMMACMGAALIMIVSSFGFSDMMKYPNVSLDPSRVASSVVIGIGYLGAGIILVLKRGNIRGLTTASGLWATAAVGLAVGGGMYFTAIAATIIAILILYVVQVIQNKLSKDPAPNEVIATFQKKEDALEIMQKLISQKFDLAAILLEHKNKKYRIRATLLGSRTDMLPLLEILKSFSTIEKIKLK